MVRIRRERCAEDVAALGGEPLARSLGELCTILRKFGPQRLGDLQEVEDAYSFLRSWTEAGPSAVV